MEAPSELCARLRIGSSSRRLEEDSDERVGLCAAGRSLLASCTIDRYLRRRSAASPLCDVEDSIGRVLERMDASDCTSVLLIDKAGGGLMDDRAVVVDVRDIFHFFFKGLYSSALEYGEGLAFQVSIDAKVGRSLFGDELKQAGISFCNLRAADAGKRARWMGVGDTLLDVLDSIMEVPGGTDDGMGSVGGSGASRQQPVSRVAVRRGPGNADVCLVSRTDLLAFLCDHLPDLGPFADLTLDELFGDGLSVLTIDASSRELPALSAFAALIENRSSLVGLVEGIGGPLLGSLSLSDLCGLKPRSFDALATTPVEFITERMAERCVPAGFRTKSHFSCPTAPARSAPRPAGAPSESGTGTSLSELGSGDDVGDEELEGAPKAPAPPLPLFRVGPSSTLRGALAEIREASAWRGRCVHHIYVLEPMEAGSEVEGPGAAPPPPVAMEAPVAGPAAGPASGAGAMPAPVPGGPPRLQRCLRSAGVLDMAKILGLFTRRPGAEQA